MNVIEMSEIGKFIRKVRKERGLRLEDLADEHISTATISNIERGVPHVNKDKVLYLMSKLGLDLSEIPEMIEKDSESLESMQVKFTAIETMIGLGNPGRAQVLLSNISEETFSRHQATIHYLKGRIYAAKKDWRKAERELSEAIRLAYQDPYSPKSNLEAVSYCGLAQCRATHKDYEQALKYVERGLEACREQNESPEQIQFQLSLNRVIYLEKLGRIDEALKNLDELWQYQSEIQNKEMVIQMYSLKAGLLRRMKMYHDAIRYAREGAMMAMSSKDYDEMFRLWNILGTSYKEISQLEDAESCFLFLLELSDHVSNKDEVVRVHCSLGHIYMLQGKFNEAREVLEKALGWTEKSHDPFEKSTALLMLGQLMKKMKHYTDAVEYFKRAVQVAVKYKFKKRIYLIYYELADCCEEMGDLEGFKDATEKMYRAKKEMEKEELFF
ncbi:MULTISPECIES: helix-turn-helix domain-containing protein [unclassified Thermoactinomyces]|jgi:tetratricopeptide (TPR) repeat protein|uniref:helix-turn-helix domain-containing protein n=1 Tax=unclassified Thermoactinomyces TaxID=2634588 RepID=UPI0018DCD23D|nr:MULTISPECIES: tetratricopeptide repeat protein [unclassified Thermoactinomyces]MBH8598446.1 tetratricopeptide repeat protein [Thermoactinomyces sp. CICC 10523]MBH8604709.1 tetratricopeptide repeat protein [Thermoactinomyces sp. CICC 10522]MBH8606830.1 tetratricopeptide repeat protein [Thermoactinomyces sp. CICC 10521]